MTGLSDTVCVCVCAVCLPFSLSLCLWHVSECDRELFNRFSLTPGRMLSLNAHNVCSRLHSLCFSIIVTFTIFFVHPVFHCKRCYVTFVVWISFQLTFYHIHTRAQRCINCNREVTGYYENHHKLSGCLSLCPSVCLSYHFWFYS